MADKRPVIPSQRIERSIFLVRGHKVLLDADLAELYNVSVKRLNEQVRRNSKRFPADFAFQLTALEYDSLRSQFATLKQGRGQHRKYPPYAFTEQGVAMLSSVLNSDRAVEVNIEIMRAFVRLREFLATHREQADKLKDLERKLGAHDQQIRAIFEAIRQLMAPPKTKRRPIGFIVRERPARYGRR
jgi:phage regulator Rha-like protein